MIVDLKQKSQVTIPKELVKKLNLSVGDKLEVEEKDGKLIITPVMVIPKSQAWYHSKEWQDQEKIVNQQIAEGRVYEVDSEENLFDGLGLNDED